MKTIYEIYDYETEGTDDHPDLSDPREPQNGPWDRVALEDINLPGPKVCRSQNRCKCGWCVDEARDAADEPQEEDF